VSAALRLLFKVLLLSGRSRYSPSKRPAR
jgi:hypothetical protein